MALQKFHDLGTEFDTDNIKGDVSWDEFVQYLKDGKSGSVVRLKYLGDYIPFSRTFIFDLSYMYVKMGNEIYNCRDFPVWNLCGSRGAVKKAVYKVCKKTGIWIPNIFSALSEHV